MVWKFYMPEKKKKVEENHWLIYVSIDILTLLFIKTCETNMKNPWKI